MSKPPPNVTFIVTQPGNGAHNSDSASGKSAPIRPNRRPTSALSLDAIPTLRTRPTIDVVAKDLKHILSQVSSETDLPQKSPFIYRQVKRDSVLSDSASVRQSTSTIPPPRPTRSPRRPKTAPAVTASRAQSLYSFYEDDEQSMLDHYFPGARRMVIQSFSAALPMESLYPVEDDPASIYSSSVPEIEDLPELSPHSSTSENRDSFLSSSDSGGSQFPQSPASIFSMSNPSIADIADHADADEIRDLDKHWTFNTNDIRTVSSDLVHREDVKPRVSSLSKAWMWTTAEKVKVTEKEKLAPVEQLPHDFIPDKKEHKMAKLWRRWKREANA